MRPKLITSILAIAFAALVPSGSAGACCPPDGEVGRCRIEYVMKLRGVAMGRILLALEQVPGTGTVRGRLRLEPAGLAALFNGGSSVEMEGWSQVGEDGVRPQRFHARYRKPDRYRDITIRYDPRDGRIAELIYDNNGERQPSPVPAPLRERTVDPVTGFLRLQRWLAAGPQADESTTARIFEGRKRLDIVLVYRGPDEGRATDAGPVRHRLAARLMGLYGFDDGYGFVDNGRGEPNWLDVTATSGRCPVPFRVSGRASGLQPSIERD